MSDRLPQKVALSALASQRSAFKPLLASAPPPIASPPADAFALGLAEGQKLAEAAFAVERTALLELLSSAQSLQPEAGDEISRLLREAVFGLVRQIVGDIAISSHLIEQQVTQVVAILTEADDARQLLLHPDDAALTGDRVSGLVVRSDAAMDRGTMRVVCSQGWIEHGTAYGLDRLRAALGLAGDMS
jgi:flagellar assembly protein FliH